MFGLGTPEIVLIAAIGLLLFGGKKMPELARSIGVAAKEMKEGYKEAPANDRQTSETSDSRHSTGSDAD